MKRSNSVLKTLIIIIMIVVGCCVGLYYIMKSEKTSNLKNDSSNISKDKNESVNNNENKNYEYIEDTDIFKPRSAFGWGKPFITNYAWESGFYYEAFGNVDGINAYNKYKEYLLSKEYELIKEEKLDETMMYTYSKDGLKVILGVKSNTFEITLSK